jgi:hypothetical protein
VNDTRAVSRRLNSWLETSLAVLSRVNPVHIHADELLGRDNASYEDQLSAIKAGYLEAIHILGNRLGYVMPVLTIPLASTDDLTCDLPDLGQLEAADEIPSVYLIHRDALKDLAQCEVYRRFLKDFTVFHPHPKDVFFFYEVFRGEQQREWGWEYARTIKGEHYLPEHRGA